jgi:pilus assembly protein Flp/PilA
VGEARKTSRLPDAPGGRAAGGLVARSALRRFARDERGATAIEYGLIACLIFLAIIGGVGLFADKTTETYNKIGTTIGGVL